jgi:starch synthase
MLARELRHERCGAILCQEYENPRFDVCVLLGWLLRIPVFATYQGGKWWLGPLERLLRPQALRACAGIIVGSGIEATRVQRRYGLPANKIARIFNPVDIRSGRTDRLQARAALGIPSDARVVVWHGRVEPVKGLDVLLEAWDQIRRERQGRDLRLLLVGTGSYSGMLHRRLDKAPPLRGVEWRDEYVHDRAVIRRYLCAADVYTLPSRHEGFPVAPIEAMSCGLPVVATDVPGVADILAGGDVGGGRIVPIGDAPALATALGRLLDDDAQAQALGRRARQRVETAFSLEAVGAQLRRLLFPTG